MRKKSVKFLLWFAGLTVVSLLICWLIGLRIWTVPDDRFVATSTAPTLAGGDVVILVESDGRTSGDLVRCRDPKDAGRPLSAEEAARGVSAQRWVIGRIYASANDRVKIEGGAVTVNGKRYGSQEACAESSVPTIDPATGVATTLRCGRLEFAGGLHFIAAGAGMDTSPTEHTVEPGRYYLVSDNRVHHDDSRDFGTIPIEHCKGKILFRLWGKSRSSSRSSSSPFTIIR